MAGSFNFFEPVSPIISVVSACFIGSERLAFGAASPFSNISSKHLYSACLFEDRNTCKRKNMRLSKSLGRLSESHNAHAADRERA